MQGMVPTILSYTLFKCEYSRKRVKSLLVDIVTRSNKLGTNPWVTLICSRKSPGQEPLEFNLKGKG